MAQTASDSSVLVIQSAGTSAGHRVTGSRLSHHVCYPYASKLEQEEARTTRRAATSAEARQRQPGKGAAGCMFDEDSHVWDGRVTKIWGEKGQIIIEEAK